ncbi:unnamed protein product [Paramecium octaurelia]|uniref:non-specific serine/threonine protein kinase n=1 Tax=Paramecium octaurelia TaxID=43137 RepID=A0A8S1UBG8_PAROT|nr:unnamed protein product [Paramecium octaurelia]
MNYIGLLNTVIEAKTNEFPNRKFTLIKLLGSGSEGGVYIANAQGWGNNSKQFALKLQKQMKESEKDFIKNLIQYQKVFDQGNDKGQLSSNIIQIYDYFEWQKQHCIIMEVGQESLYHFTSQNKIPVQEKNKVLIQITLPILFLHNAKLIHRDLKPENYIKVGDTFKLIDFGLVRGSNPQDIKTMSVGSLVFQAPEMIQNSNNYNEKIDIWSLACVFYEVLSSQTLFDGQNYQQLTQQIINHKFPANINNKINQLQTSEKIKNLLVNMLSYVEAKRPTIQQVYNELQQQLPEKSQIQIAIERIQILENNFKNIEQQFEVDAQQISKGELELFDKLIQSLKIDLKQLNNKYLEMDQTIKNQQQFNLEQQNKMETLVNSQLQQKQVQFDSQIKQLEGKYSQLEIKITKQFFDKDQQIELQKQQIQQQTNEKKQMEEKLNFAQTQLQNQQKDFETKIQNKLNNIESSIAEKLQSRDKIIESLKQQVLQQTNEKKLMEEKLNSAQTQSQNQQQELESKIQNKISNIEKSIAEKLEFKDQLIGSQKHQIQQQSNENKSFDQRINDYLTQLQKQQQDFEIKLEKNILNVASQKSNQEETILSPNIQNYIEDKLKDYFQQQIQEYKDQVDNINSNLLENQKKQFNDQLLKIQQNVTNKIQECQQQNGNTIEYRNQEFYQDSHPQNEINNQNSANQEYNLEESKLTNNQGLNENYLNIQQQNQIELNQHNSKALKDNHMENEKQTTNQEMISNQGQIENHCQQQCLDQQQQSIQESQIKDNQKQNINEIMISNQRSIENYGQQQCLEEQQSDISESKIKDNQKQNTNEQGISNQRSIENDDQQQSLDEQQQSIQESQVKENSQQNANELRIDNQESKKDDNENILSSISQHIQNDENDSQNSQGFLLKYFSQQGSILIQELSQIFMHNYPNNQQSTQYLQNQDDLIQQQENQQLQQISQPQSSLQQSQSQLSNLQNIEYAQNNQQEINETYHQHQQNLDYSTINGFKIHFENLKKEISQKVSEQFNILRIADLENLDKITNLKKDVLNLTIKLERFKIVSTEEKILLLEKNQEVIKQFEAEQQQLKKKQQKDGQIINELNSQLSNFKTENNQLNETNNSLKLMYQEFKRDSEAENAAKQKEYDQLKISFEIFQQKSLDEKEAKKIECDQLIHKIQSDNLAEKAAKQKEYDQLKLRFENLQQKSLDEKQEKQKECDQLIHKIQQDSLAERKANQETYNKLKLNLQKVEQESLDDKKAKQTEIDLLKKNISQFQIQQNTLQAELYKLNQDKIEKEKTLNQLSTANKSMHLSLEQAKQPLNQVKALINYFKNQDNLKKFYENQNAEYMELIEAINQSF